MGSLRTHYRYCSLSSVLSFFRRVGKVEECVEAWSALTSGLSPGNALN